MITFQPALDPHHTIFRILRLSVGLSQSLPLEIDKVRIIDYYLAFPFRASAFQFRRGQSALRRAVETYENVRPYGGFPDDRDLFLRMRPVQTVAFETLAARGLIDPDALKQRMLLSGDASIPEPLFKRIVEANSEQNDLITVLTAICETNQLLGSDGIKQRSGLMEYRYDAI